VHEKLSWKGSLKMRLIGDRSRGRDVLRGEMISNVLYNGKNEMQELLDTESQSDCRARRLSWGKGRCGMRMRVSKTRSQLGDPRNHCGKWLKARKLPRFILDKPLSAGSCLSSAFPFIPFLDPCRKTMSSSNSNNNHSNNNNNNSGNDRRSDVDKFDEIWSSILDTATDLTRSIVGLPMFYRHHHHPRHSDTQGVLVVYAEPGILTPNCITYHLDRDIAGINGPFRFESRPVTVFDVFTQRWRVTEDQRNGPGMMFLFGSPFENGRGIGASMFKYPGESLLRPWMNPHEWISRSIYPIFFQIN